MLHACFSATELSRQISRNKSELLIQCGGPKDYSPDGSWLQDKKLESFHRDHQQLLKRERVEIRSNLCEGDWLLDVSRVYLKRDQGKHFTTMGYVTDGKKMLYPEEALYLMDIGALELSYGGVAMSVQQAYSTLLGPDVTIDHYLVYSHLTRQGYIVYRHKGMTKVTAYERKIRLDQHLTEDLLFEKPRQKSHKQSLQSVVVDCPVKTDDSGTLNCDHTTNIKIEPKAGNSNITEDSENLSSECKMDSSDTSCGHKDSSLNSENTDSKPVTCDQGFVSGSTNMDSLVDSTSVSSECKMDSSDTSCGQKDSTLNSKNTNSKPVTCDQGFVSGSTNMDSLIDSTSESSYNTGDSSGKTSDIKDHSEANTDHVSDKKCTDSDIEMIYSDSKMEESRMNMPESIYFDEGNQGATKSVSVRKRTHDSCHDMYQSQSKLAKTDFCSSKETAKHAVYVNSNWDFTDIVFPNLAVGSWKKPVQKYMPPNTEVTDAAWERSRSLFDLSSNEPCGTSDITYEFSYPETNWKVNKKARNWSEYKADQGLQDGDEVLMESPAGHLWKGEVKPLVKPRQAKSTRNVLNVLPVTPELDILEETSLLPDQQPPAIVYDVYIPNNKFKKSMPGIPHHRVVVVSAGETPPSMNMLIQMSQRYRDNVPLHWAAVDDGDISYFTFQDVSLPVTITTG